MLFNSIGQGDFLAVHALSTPTVDLPATVAGPLTLAAPALAVYATRTANQLAVFVLSRKMDNYTAPQEPGFTPLVLRLPLRSAQTVTLYAMTGDARLTNLDADLVQINQTAIAPSLFNRDFRLDQLRGVSSAGLPPGATMVYVFGGAVFDPPGPPTPTVVLHRTQPSLVTYPTVTILFSVVFDQAVSGLDSLVNDFVVTGSASGASVVAISTVYGMGNTSFTVTVSGMQRRGTVRLGVVRGAATLAGDATVLSRASALSPEVTFVVSSILPDAPYVWARDMGTGLLRLNWNASLDPAKLYDNFTVCGGNSSGACAVRYAGLVQLSLDVPNVLSASQVCACGV